LHFARYFFLITNLIKNSKLFEKLGINFLIDMEESALLPPKPIGNTKQKRRWFDERSFI